jgi:hypothetical protein
MPNDPDPSVDSKRVPRMSASLTAVMFAILFLAPLVVGRFLA